MFSSLFVILLLHGKRRECLEEPPLEEDVFAPEHYDEVGFLRDVCVELGRKLIKKLRLPDATEPCQNLALTRTSTCWPFHGCDKWKRDDPKNKEANEKVFRRALRMVKDFNKRVSEYPAISNLEDQKFIWRAVGVAVIKLIRAGAVDPKSDLIGKKNFEHNFCETALKNNIHFRKSAQYEIRKLRSNYCRQCYVDEPPNSLRKAFQREDEERARNMQAICEGYSQQIDPEENKSKGSSLWSETDNEYQQTEISREIEIEFVEDCKLETGQKISTLCHEDSTSYRKNEKEDESEDEKEEVEQGELALHESVFRGNWKKFMNLLNKGYDVTKKDKHGNTALHLAAMLGREDYIERLIEFNPPMRTRNILGWSAMDEAISYRDEEIVNMMMPTYNRQFTDGMTEKRRQLIHELKNLKDFYLEMRWDFGCWIPGIAYLLPSDTCKIRKHGSSVRMDTTLIGFDETRLRYKRGSLTYLFDSTTSPNPTTYVLNNEEKWYMKFDMKLEENNTVKAEDVVKNGIPRVTMSRSCITFSPLTNWIRLDRKIGRFKAEYYEVKNMVVKFQVRDEHLTKREIKKKAAETKRNSNFISNAMKGKLEESKEDAKEWQDEDNTVEPVPPCQVTWEQYINSAPGEYPTLGRPMRLQDQSVQVKTTVGMSKELKLPVDTFVRILEVIAPLKHFDKVREFLQLKLPEGFPVKLEIPLFPTLSARITFPEFKSCSELEEGCFSEQLFHLPEDYKELGEDSDK